MQNTTSPTGAATVAAETQNINNLPEWLRIKAACQRFGVSRSWLYVRIASGQIKSRCLRQRGAIKGIRLISRDSLALFIENATEGIA
ncbi:MAG: helix-turn-helix transcriptional regulator [Chthoniobacteraceae bacterium]